MPKQKGKNKNQPKRRTLYVLLSAIGLLILMWLLFYYGTARFRIVGPSMEPALQDGSYVLVSKLLFLNGDVARGELVAFYVPYNNGETSIKRVIGITGDRIAVVEGKLILNGVEQVNFSDNEQFPVDLSEITVPDGSVFVLGDNLHASSDSRVYGPVSLDLVIGEVVFQW